MRNVESRACRRRDSRTARSRRLQRTVFPGSPVAAITRLRQRSCAERSAARASRMRSWKGAASDRRTARAAGSVRFRSRVRWPGGSRSVRRVEVLELPAVPVGVEFCAETLEDVRHVAGGDLEDSTPARWSSRRRTCLRSRCRRQRNRRRAAGGKPWRGGGCAGCRRRRGRSHSPGGRATPRRGIGGAHVGGGDHPDQDAAVAQFFEGGHQQAQAGPLDERDQDVSGNPIITHRGN